MNVSAANPVISVLVVLRRSRCFTCALNIEALSHNHDLLISSLLSHPSHLLPQLTHYVLIILHIASYLIHLIYTYANMMKQEDR